MAIPGISTDEVIDRYMRGLKHDIPKELCRTNYSSLTELMSHTLSTEVSKAARFRTMPNMFSRNQPVPMDISNTRLSPSRKRQIDIENRACFICYKPGCRRDRCPMRKQANNCSLLIEDERKRTPSKTDFRPDWEKS